MDTPEFLRGKKERFGVSDRLAVRRSQFQVYYQVQSMEIMKERG
ncbi:hypothetical protein [Nostoc sp.]